MEVPETMLHPPNKIPKLLLSRAKNTHGEAIHPASLSGIGGVNVHWEGLTGKVTSTPRPPIPHGLERKPLNENTKIPGYTGHKPAAESTAIGKSFGFMTSWTDREATRLNTARTAREMMGTARSGSLTARSGLSVDRFNHLDYDAPLSARTVAEERILERKLAGRSWRPKGSNELASLRLATTTPRKAVRSQDEVESAWRASQMPKGSQTFERLKSDTTDPKLVGPQPYGVPPNREDREWRVAQEYLRQHLHAAGAWDPNLDRKYTQADPSMGWTASGAYEVARGWMGFGLRVPEQYAGDSRFWNSWHTTYFPCPAEWLPTVLDKLECVIPGDAMLGGDRIKIVHMAQKGATEKIDPNSANKDRCCTRLYTTPSIRYAAAKIAAITRGGGFDVFQDRKLYFVLECKQKGGPLYTGGFHTCKETVGWEESQPRKSRISPHFENGEIEYYTLRKNSVVPYRVLVLTDDVEMVEVKASDGSLRQTPLKQWRQVKWGRKDHPQYGYGSMPGLCPPFKEFADPSTDQPLSRGGTACPRASVPVVSYPEMSPIRDPLDPILRPSTQPSEPEASVMPSHGWKDGTMPEAWRNMETHKLKSTATMREEIRSKFAEAEESVRDLLERLGREGRGVLKREQIERLLVRMRVVHNEGNDNFDALWKEMDPKGTGGVSLSEFSRMFGLLSKMEEAYRVCNERLGQSFSTIQRAFDEWGIDGDGGGRRMGKEELKRQLHSMNLLQQKLSTLHYRDIYAAIDKDPSIPTISVDEFAENFSGAARVLPTARIDTASSNLKTLRKTFKAKGSEAWTIDGMCEEGNVCYGNGDYETAEKRYRAALRVDPKHVRTLCSLAWLLKTVKGDNHAARGVIRRAIEAEPTNPYVVMQEALY